MPTPQHYEELTDAFAHAIELPTAARRLPRPDWPRPPVPARGARAAARVGRIDSSGHPRRPAHPPRCRRAGRQRAARNERAAVAARARHGGAGTVYEAQQRRPRRRVAVKVLHNTHAADSDTFWHEADVLAQVRHPGVAQVYAADTTADGRSYLVMELIDDAPITQHATRHAPRPACGRPRAAGDPSV